jgi:DNA mismatch repair protein MLH3
MIQRLGSDVISELRSGVALSSLSQCVEELVLNSIDAGSSSITVDVDISTISLEVSDNGTGVRQSDLKNVGQRYFTSKCHSLKDLENAASYGFRGEALASLGKICQKIEMVSRHKASSRTFCKLVKKGRDMGVYESTGLRPRHGMTVKVYGVFDTLPVRQKLISEKVDLEQIRRRVLGVVLMNPGVSILVRNKENGTSLLQTHACTSTLSVVSQVFGCSKSKDFKPVSQTCGVHTITGYVSLEGFPNRNFQFFYVNKRLVLKTRFHNVAHHILARAITGLTMVDRESTNQDQGLCSPKKLDKYASFVLNIECPYNTYDITFDPKKTLVEFQNWDEPIICLKECLNDFLKREGIFNEELFNIQSDSQESCPSLSQEFDLVKPGSEVGMEYPNVTKRPIKASDLRRSLYSSTAKRKRNGNAAYNVGIMSSSSDAGLKHTCNSNESSYVANERDIDGKWKTEELGLSQDCSVSSDEFSSTSKEGISPHSDSSVAVLNKLEKSSKRSIIAKLQKYSTGISRPSNVSPSGSNCTFSSSASSCNEWLARKIEGTLNMKLESVNSHDGKRKCLGVSQEGEEVNEMGDVRSKRKFNAPKQPNDSRTPVDVQQFENVSVLILHDYIMLNF